MIIIRQNAIKRFALMWWPAYASVVVVVVVSTKWGSRRPISRERFDLESSNFARTFKPVGSTTTPDMTSLYTVYKVSDFLFLMPQFNHNCLDVFSTSAYNDALVMVLSKYIVLRYCLADDSYTHFGCFAVIQSEMIAGFEIQGCCTIRIVVEVHSQHFLSTSTVLHWITPHQA